MDTTATATAPIPIEQTMMQKSNADFQARIAKSLDEIVAIQQYAKQMAEASAKQTDAERDKTNQEKKTEDKEKKEEKQEETDFHKMLQEYLSKYDESNKTFLKVFKDQAEANKILTKKLHKENLDAYKKSSLIYGAKGKMERSKMWLKGMAQKLGGKALSIVPGMKYTGKAMAADAQKKLDAIKDERKKINEGAARFKAADKLERGKKKEASLEKKLEKLITKKGLTSDDLQTNKKVQALQARLAKAVGMTDKQAKLAGVDKETAASRKQRADVLNERLGLRDKIKDTKGKINEQKLAEEKKKKEEEEAKRRQAREKIVERFKKFKQGRKSPEERYKQFKTDKLKEKAFKFSGDKFKQFKQAQDTQKMLKMQGNTFKATQKVGQISKKGLQFVGKAAKASGKAIMAFGKMLLPILMPVLAVIATAIAAVAIGTALFNKFIKGPWGDYLEQQRKEHEEKENKGTADLHAGTEEIAKKLGVDPKEISKKRASGQALSDKELAYVQAMEKRSRREALMTRLGLYKIQGKRRQEILNMNDADFEKWTHSREAVGWIESDDDEAQVAQYHQEVAADAKRNAKAQAAALKKGTVPETPMGTPPKPTAQAGAPQKAGADAEEMQEKRRKADLEERQIKALESIEKSTSETAKKKERTNYIMQQERMSYGPGVQTQPA